MKRASLKPGKPLERRTPLRSKATQPRRSVTPLKPRSADKAAEDRENAKVREAVFRRDGGCVLQRHLRHRCFGPLTPHHIVKASQGGPYALANLVALCAWGNDTWVEQNREQAREFGLHRDSWEAAGA